MIAQRIANKLNESASKAGLTVQICHSAKPKRQWYSVGNFHDGKWHQITGFTAPDSVEEFLKSYGK